jgi:hypothetical protein
VSNIFIVSLAVSDILVAVTVMPLSAVYALAGRWPLGLVACQVWMGVDYTASTASILNLFTLSVDRYWSVTSPLRYLHQRTKRRAAVMITLTWFVSLLWLLPIAFWHHAVNGGRRLVSPDVCETEFSSSRPFKVISAVVNYYLPLAVMVILNINIFIEIRQRALDFCDKCDAAVRASPMKKIDSGGRGQLRIDRRPPSQRRPLCKQNTIELECLTALPARALRDISEGVWANNPLCQATVSGNASLRYQSLKRQLQILDELDEEKTATAAAAIDRDDSCKDEDSSDNSLSPETGVTEQHTQMLRKVFEGHQFNERSPRSLSTAEMSDVITMQQQTQARQHINFAITPDSVYNEINTCTLLSNGMTQQQLSRTSSSETDDEGNDVMWPPARSRQRMFVDWAKVMDDITVVRRRINSTFAVKEGKAARQLCVIMSVFIICFLPYFVCYVIVAFQPMAVSAGLMRAVTWFGYINSTLNPLLYSLCNAQFRRTFRKFFRFRRLVTVKRPRSTKYTTVLRSKLSPNVLSNQVH